MILGSTDGAHATPGSKTEQECEQWEHNGAHIRPLTAGPSRSEPARHVEESHRIEDEERAHQCKENRRQTKDSRACLT